MNTPPAESELAQTGVPPDHWRVRAQQTRYDYIVVGAGSAGCVLARRLLDRRAGRVLLLEAGGPDTREAIHDTALGSIVALWTDSGVSWRYVTAPQRHLSGRSIPIPQGKVLGGGSSLNALLYVRGNRRDFDHWRDLGNEGWGYRDVLPYFIRSENFLDGATELRGGDGPLTVAGPGEPAEASLAFVRAAGELGFTSGGVLQWDYNGARQENAAFLYQSTRTKDNRRCSTAVGYLRSVLDHPDLTVATGAHATRILLDGGTATGVEYLQGATTRQARAEAEVIVACGALGSPKLLMLSGIGPAGHLREHGIRPVLNLPGVGRDLQDHLLFGIGYECLRELPEPQLLAEAGLFTHTSGGTVTGSPDLQLLFGPVQYLDARYRVDGPGFTAAPVLAQPRSRGTVTLRSGDARDLPIVDPGYLVDGADLEVFLRAVPLVRELVGGRAFAGLRGRELAPGGGVTDRAGLTRYICDAASTMWHPVGTCRMGPDEGAVVDARLRVRGMARLRVVDASVMPTIPCGNPNAATIMIAEKAADMIMPGAGEVDG